MSDATLRAAVAKGNVSKVSALLKSGGAVAAADAKARSSSLVGEALSRGHIAVAALLLEHGAKPQPAEGVSLLVGALKADGASLIAPLLAALGDAATTAVCDVVREWTPLMHAAKMGALDAMAALLEAGAEVDVHHVPGGPLDEVNS